MGGYVFLNAIKKNMTIPNCLTALRIVLIVPMVSCLLKEQYAPAGVCLLASALSDMCDGWIARKFHQVTSLGKVLDPIADKLTLIAVVICIYLLYPYIYPFMVLLFAKEVIMLAGGAILLHQHIRPPAARWFGKAATAVFYASVISIIALRAVWNINVPPLLTSLLALTSACMIFALCGYASMFFQLLKEKDESYQ